VDVGHAYKAKAELQRAADAGALGGVVAMFPGGAAKSCTMAVSTGEDLARRNQVDEENSSLADITVQSGKYTLPSGPFATSACDQANAVEAVVRKRLDMYFASVFGVNSMTPSGRAVALSKITGSLPGGKAFPFCIDHSKVPPQGAAGQILINTTSSDFGCWTPFFDPNGKVKDLLDGTVQAPAVKVGDIINVKNGVTANDFKTLKSTYIGQYVVVPVIRDGAHSGETAILGFARIKIIGVDEPGGGSGDKIVIVETQQQNYVDTQTGGGGTTNYNLAAAGSSLVQ
jgi:hypothetical protein